MRENHKNIQVERFNRRIAIVAKGFRELADEIERIGQRDSSTYERKARDILHAIAWTVPNLAAHNLVEVTADIREAEE